MNDHASWCLFCSTNTASCWVQDPALRAPPSQPATKSNKVSKLASMLGNKKMGKRQLSESPSHLPTPFTTTAAPHDSSQRAADPHTSTSSQRAADPHARNSSHQATDGYETPNHVGDFKANNGGTQHDSWDTGPTNLVRLAQFGRIRQVLPYRWGYRFHVNSHSQSQP